MKGASFLYSSSILSRPITMPTRPRMCIGRSFSKLPVSPIIENAPITGSEAIEKYSDLLMPYEKAEITRFKQIYFLGYPSAKNQTPCKGKFQYQIRPKDHLNYRYEVKSILGAGSFGQVVEAYDHKTKREIAIKILMNAEDIKEQSAIEAKILITLNKNKCANAIKGIDFFVFRSRVCISFELLGNNLYAEQSKINFQPMKISLVKDYALQIFKCLADIAKLGIIHCDIKPDNICTMRENPALIKVVDFGSACFSNAQYYTYIQSRYYRAPEVILELKYSPAIDVWSAALVIVELLVSRPLFPGKSELDMLNMMKIVLGEPPKYMINGSPRSKLFFYENGKLKPSKSSKKNNNNMSLKSILGQNVPKEMVDFLRQCLLWDPLERMTASEALKHPFLQNKYENQKEYSNQESLPRLNK